MLGGGAGIAAGGVRIGLPASLINLPAVCVFIFCVCCYRTLWHEDKPSAHKHIQNQLEQLLVQHNKKNTKAATACLDSCADMS